MGVASSSERTRLGFDRLSESVALYDALVAPSLRWTAASAAEAQAMRAQAKTSPSAGLREWAPDDWIIERVDEVEEDALHLLPVQRVADAPTGDASVAGAAWQRQSVLSASTLQPPVPQLYSSLLVEAGSLAKHSLIHSYNSHLGEDASRVAHSVRELRRGLQRGVEGQRARASQIAKLLADVKAAYAEPTDDSESGSSAGADSAAAASSSPPNPEGMDSATVALQKLLQSRGRVSKSEVESKARTALGSIMSTVMGGANGSGKAAPAFAVLGHVQRVAFKSMVSTALIFLNALQQHDPLVLAQVLQLTRDALVELRTPSALCNTRQNLGAAGVSVEAVRALAPVFEFYGNLIARVPAFPATSDVIKASLPSSPFGNLLALPVQASAGSRGLPPTLRQSVSRALPSSAEEAVTPQLLRTQCIEVSMLWSLSRGNLVELLRWLHFLLDQDVFDAASAGGFRPSSGASAITPAYDVRPFMDLLAGYMHDAAQVEQEEAAQLRELAHAALAPQRERERTARLRAQAKEMLARRAFIGLSTEKKRKSGRVGAVRQRRGSHSNAGAPRLQRQSSRGVERRVRRVRAESGSDDGSEDASEEEDADAEEEEDGEDAEDEDEPRIMHRGQRVRLGSRHSAGSDAEDEEEKSDAGSAAVSEEDDEDVDAEDEDDDDDGDDESSLSSGESSSSSSSGSDDNDDEEEEENDGPGRPGDKGKGNSQSLHGVLYLSAMFEAAEADARAEATEEALVRRSLAQVKAQQEQEAQARRALESEGSGGNAMTAAAYKRPRDFQPLPHLMLREFGLEPRAEAGGAATGRRAVPTPVLLMFISAHLDRLSARLAPLLGSPLPGSVSAAKTAPAKGSSSDESYKESAKKARKRARNAMHFVTAADMAVQRYEAALANSFIDPLVLCPSEEGFSELAALVDLLAPLYVRPPPISSSSSPSSSSSSSVSLAVDCAAMPLCDYMAYMSLLLSSLRLLGRHLCAVAVASGDGEANGGSKASHFLSTSLATRLRETLWSLFRVAPAIGVAAAGTDAEEPLRTNLRLIRHSVRATIQSILSDAYLALHPSDETENAALVSAGDDGSSEDEEKRESRSGGGGNKLYMLGTILALWREEDTQQAQDALPASPPVPAPALSRSLSTPAAPASVFPALVSSFLSSSSPSFLPSVQALMAALHPTESILASPWSVVVQRLARRAPGAAAAEAKRRAAAKRKREEEARRRRRHGSDSDESGSDSDSSRRRRRQEEPTAPNSEDEEERELRAPADPDAPFESGYIEAQPPAGPVSAAPVASSSSRSTGSAPSSSSGSTLLARAVTVQARQSRAQLVLNMFELLCRAAHELEQQQQRSNAAGVAATAATSAAPTSSTASSSSSSELPVDDEGLPTLDLTQLQPAQSSFDLFNRRMPSAAPLLPCVAVGATRAVPELDCTTAPWLPSLLAFFDAFQKLLLYSTQRTLVLHARIQKEKERAAAAAAVAKRGSASAASKPAPVQPEREEKQREEKEQEEEKAQEMPSASAIAAASPVSAASLSSPSTAASSVSVSDAMLLAPLEVTRRYVTEVVQLLLLPHERATGAASTGEPQELLRFVSVDVPVPAQKKQRGSTEEKGAEKAKGQTVVRQVLSPVSFVLLHSLLHPLLLGLLHMQRLDSAPLVAALLPMLQRGFASLHGKWLAMAAANSDPAACGAASISGHPFEILAARVKPRRATAPSLAKHPGLHDLAAPTPTVWLAGVLLPLFAYVVSSSARQCLRVLTPFSEQPQEDELEPLSIEWVKGELDRADALRERERTPGTKEFKAKQERDKKEKERAAAADPEEQRLNARVAEWAQHTRLLQGGLAHKTLMTAVRSEDNVDEGANALRHLHDVLQRPTSRDETFDARFAHVLPWVAPASAVVTSASAALVSPSSPLRLSLSPSNASSPSDDEEEAFLSAYFSHAPELDWFTALLAKPAPVDPKASALGRRPPVATGPRLQKSIVEIAAKASKLYFCVLVRQLRRVHLCVREVRLRAEHTARVAALQSSLPAGTPIPDNLMPPSLESLRAPAKLSSLYAKSLEIQHLFAKCKGAGGNVEQLYEQIRERAAFLCFETGLMDERAPAGLLSMTAADVRGPSVPNSPAAVRSALTSPASSSVHFSPQMMPARAGPLHHSFSTPTALGGAAADTLPPPSALGPGTLERKPSRWIKARALIRLLCHTLGAVVRLKKMLSSRKVLGSADGSAALASSGGVNADALRSPAFKHLEHEVQLSQAAFIFLTMDMNALSRGSKGAKAANADADDASSASGNKRDWNALFVSRLRDHMMLQHARGVWRAVGLYHFDQLAQFLLATSDAAPATEQALVQADAQAASVNPAALLRPHTPAVLLNFRLLEAVLLHLRVPTMGSNVKSAGSFANSASLSTAVTPTLQLQFRVMYERVFAAVNTLRSSHPSIDPLNGLLVNAVGFLPAVGTAPTMALSSPAAAEWESWRMVSRKIEGFLEPRCLSESLDPSSWLRASPLSLGGGDVLSVVSSSHTTSWEVTLGSWAVYRLMAYRAAEVVAELHEEAALVAANNAQAEKKRNKQAKLLGGGKQQAKQHVQQPAAAPSAAKPTHPAQQLSIDILRFVHSQLQKSAAKRRVLRERMEQLRARSASTSDTVTAAAPKGFGVCRSCFFPGNSIDATRCLACGKDGSITVRPIVLPSSSPASKAKSKPKSKGKQRQNWASLDNDAASTLSEDADLGEESTAEETKESESKANDDGDAEKEDGEDAEDAEEDVDEQGEDAEDAEDGEDGEDGEEGEDDEEVDDEAEDASATDDDNDDDDEPSQRKRGSKQSSAKDDRWRVRAGNKATMSDSELDLYLQRVKLGHSSCAGVMLDARLANSPLLYLSPAQLETLPPAFTYSFLERCYAQLSLHINQQLWLLLRMLSTNSCLVELALAAVAPVAAARPSTTSDAEQQFSWVTLLHDLLREDSGAPDAYSTVDGEPLVASDEAKTAEGVITRPFNNPVAWITRVLSLRVLRIVLPLCSPSDAAAALVLSSAFTTTAAGAGGAPASPLRGLVESCLLLIGGENVRPLDLVQPKSRAATKKKDENVDFETALAGLFDEEEPEQDGEDKEDALAAAAPYAAAEIQEKALEVNDNEKGRSRKRTPEQRRAFEAAMQRASAKRTHLARLNRSQSVADECVSFLRVLMTHEAPDAAGARRGGRPSSVDEDDEEQDDEEDGPAMQQQQRHHQQQHRAAWKSSMFSTLLEIVRGAPASLKQLLLSASQLHVPRTDGDVAEAWSKLLLPRLSSFCPSLLLLFGALSVLGGCIPVLCEGAMIEIHQILMDSNDQRKIGTGGGTGALSSRVVDGRLPIAGADSRGAGDAAPSSAAAGGGGSGDPHLGVVLGMSFGPLDDESDEEDDDPDSEVQKLDEQQRVLEIQMPDGDKYDIEVDTAVVIDEIAVPALVDSATPRHSPFFRLAEQFLDAFGRLLVLRPPALFNSHQQLSLLLLQLHRRLLQILPGFLSQKALVEHWMSASSGVLAAQGDLEGFHVGEGDEDGVASPFARHIATASLTLIDPPDDLRKVVQEQAKSDSSSSSSNKADANARPGRAHWETYLASLDRCKPVVPAATDEAASRAVGDALRKAGFLPDEQGQQEDEEEEEKKSDKTEQSESKKDDEKAWVTAARVFGSEEKAVAPQSIVALYTEPLHTSMDDATKVSSTVATASASVLQTPNWQPLVSARDLRAYHRGRILVPSNDGSVDPPLAATKPLVVGAAVDSNHSALRHQEVQMVAYMASNDPKSSVQSPAPNQFRLTSGDRFAHFHFDGLLLTAGKWFWTMTLESGSNHQIGCATPAFRPRAPDGDTYFGFGDDNESWIVDCCRHITYHGTGAEEVPFARNFTWRVGEQIGLGIDIDPVTSRASLSVWGPQGQFVGVAFDKTIDASHGLFPAFSIDGPGRVLVHASPEYFGRCIVPEGYRPLVAPKLDPARPLAPYPAQAYLFEPAGLPAETKAPAESKEEEEKKSSGAAEVQPSPVDIINLAGVGHRASFVRHSSSAAVADSAGLLRVPLAYPSRAYALASVNSPTLLLQRSHSEPNVPLDPVAEGLTVSFPAAFASSSAATDEAAAARTFVACLRGADGVQVLLEHETASNSLVATVGERVERAELTQEVLNSTIAASRAATRAKSAAAALASLSRQTSAPSAHRASRSSGTSTPADNYGCSDNESDSCEESSDYDEEDETDYDDNDLPVQRVFSGATPAARLTGRQILTAQAEARAAAAAAAVKPTVEGSGAAVSTMLSELAAAARSFDPHSVGTADALHEVYLVFSTDGRELVVHVNNQSVLKVPTTLVADHHQAAEDARRAGKDAPEPLRLEVQVPSLAASEVNPALRGVSKASLSESIVEVGVWEAALTAAQLTQLRDGGLMHVYEDALELRDQAAVSTVLRFSTDPTHLPVGVRFEYPEAALAEAASVTATSGPASASASAPATVPVSKQVGLPITASSSLRIARPPQCEPQTAKSDAATAPTPTAASASAAAAASAPSASSSFLISASAPPPSSTTASPSDDNKASPSADASFSVLVDFQVLAWPEEDASASNNDKQEQLWKEAEEAAAKMLESHTFAVAADAAASAPAAAAAAPAEAPSEDESLLFDLFGDYEPTAPVLTVAPRGVAPVDNHVVLLSLLPDASAAMQRSTYLALHHDGFMRWHRAGLILARSAAPLPPSPTPYRLAVLRSRSSLRVLVNGVDAFQSQLDSSSAESLAFMHRDGLGAEIEVGRLVAQRLPLAAHARQAVFEALVTFFKKHAPASFVSSFVAGAADTAAAAVLTPNVLAALADLASLDRGNPAWVLDALGKLVEKIDRNPSERFASLASLVVELRRVKSREMRNFPLVTAQEKSAVGGALSPFVPTPPVIALRSVAILSSGDDDAVAVPAAPLGVNLARTSLPLCGVPVTALGQAAEAVAPFDPACQGGADASAAPLSVSSAPGLYLRARESTLVGIDKRTTRNPFNHAFGSMHQFDKHVHPLEYRADCGYATGVYGCDVCGRNFNGPVYGCRVCTSSGGWDCCPMCFVPSVKEASTRNPHGHVLGQMYASQAHPHPLQFCDRITDPRYGNGLYDCDLCRITGDPAQVNVYRCASGCTSDFHPFCLLERSFHLPLTLTDARLAAEADSAVTGGVGLNALSVSTAGGPAYCPPMSLGVVNRFAEVRRSLFAQQANLAALGARAAILQQLHPHFSRNRILSTLAAQLSRAQDAEAAKVPLNDALESVGSTLLKHAYAVVRPDAPVQSPSDPSLAGPQALLSGSGSSATFLRDFLQQLGLPPSALNRNTPNVWLDVPAGTQATEGVNTQFPEDQMVSPLSGLTACQTNVLRGAGPIEGEPWREQEANKKQAANTLPKPLPSEFKSHAHLQASAYLALRRTAEQGLIALYARQVVIHSLKTFNDAGRQMQPAQIQGLQRATSLQQAAAAAALANAKAEDADADDLPPTTTSGMHLAPPGPSELSLSRTFSNTSSSSGGAGGRPMPSLARTASVQAAATTISFPFARFGSIGFLPRLMRTLDFEHADALLGADGGAGSAAAAAAAASSSSSSASSNSEDSQQMARTLRSIVVGEMFALESLIYSQLLQQHARTGGMSLSALDRSKNAPVFERSVGPTPALMQLLEQEAPICAQLLRENFSQLLALMFDPTLLDPPVVLDGQPLNSNKQLSLPSPRFILFCCMLFLERLQKVQEQEQRGRARLLAAKVKLDAAAQAKALSTEALCSLFFPPPLVHGLFTFMVLHPVPSVRLTFMRLLVRVLAVAPLSTPQFAFITSSFRAVDTWLSKANVSSASMRPRVTLLQKAVLDLHAAAQAKFAMQVQQEARQAKKREAAKRAAAAAVTAAASGAALDRADSKPDVDDALQASTSLAVVFSSGDASSAASSGGGAGSKKSLSVSISTDLHLHHLTHVLTSDEAEPTPSVDGAAGSGSNWTSGFASGIIESMLDSRLPFAASTLEQRSLRYYVQQFEARAPPHACHLYTELTVYLNALAQQALSVAAYQNSDLSIPMTFLQVLGTAMKPPPSGAAAAAAGAGTSTYSGPSGTGTVGAWWHALLSDFTESKAASSSSLKPVLLMRQLDQEVSKFPSLASLNIYLFTFHALVLLRFNNTVASNLPLLDLTAVPSPSAIAQGALLAAGKSTAAGSSMSSASPFALPATPFESLHSSPRFDRLFACKALLLSHVKAAWLAVSMKKTNERGSGSLEIDSFRAAQAPLHSLSFAAIRQTTFGQAFRQQFVDAHLKFRHATNERCFNVTYVGLHASDAGGPYRESIAGICEDLMSARVPFFVPVPNAKAGTGSHRDCWVTRPYFCQPSPFSTEPVPPQMQRTYLLRKQCYRFVGQLMGLAIRTKYLLPLQLPPLLWKLLVQEEVGLKEIEEIDQLSFSLLNDLQRMQTRIKSAKLKRAASSSSSSSAAAAAGDEERKESDAAASSSSSSGAAFSSIEEDQELFDSLISELKFEATAADGRTHDLLPRGGSLALSSENWQQYSHLLRQFRLHEFDAEAREVRHGLHSVVPPSFLRLLTWSELRHLVVGSGVVDLELLQRMSTVSSGLQNTPTIGYFWNVLKKRFTAKQHAQFLQFVWGRSTLPSREQDFERKMAINVLHEGNNPDQNLPLSHTCFFGIDLPLYTSEDILYSKLLYAIENTSSIDGDSSIQHGSGRGRDTDVDDEDWGFE